MNEPLAGLAGYFCRQAEVPDGELVRLTAAARAGGSRREAIAAGCGIQAGKDIAGVVSLALHDGSYTGADLLFGATQHSVQKLTGSGRYFPPLRWDCPGCGQQITGRVAAGRPVHVEHGHTPGCARLDADQAADGEPGCRG